MNKIFIVLSTVVFAACLCFAEDTVTPTTPADTGVTPPAATITFSGTVNFISSAYIMSGAKRQMNIKDENGFETIFVIDPEAVITGKDGSSTTVNWISKGDKVSVEYLTDTHGVKIIKSIDVLAGW